MAAAYQTGVSSSPTNLLQTLVTWLVAQGWTSDSSVSDGSGWRAHLHKSGVYVNLRAAANESIWPKTPGGGNWDAGAGYGIGLYLGDGYSGGSGWSQQSGRPLRIDGSVSGCGMNLPSGSVAAYHFFDDGSDNITIVVERSPGIFAQMGWGLALANAGNPSSFPYFHASTSAYRNVFSGALAQNLGGINITCWPPMSHADLDLLTTIFPNPSEVHATCFAKVDATTWSGRWISDASRLNEGAGYTGRLLRCALKDNPAVPDSGPMDESEFVNFKFVRGHAYQSAFTSPILLPLHVFCEMATARWARIGYPGAIFWSEGVGHGISAGEIKAVGGLNYMFFPKFAVRKAA